MDGECARRQPDPEHCQPTASLLRRHCVQISDKEVVSCDTPRKYVKGRIERSECKAFQGGQALTLHLPAHHSQRKNDTIIHKAAKMGSKIVELAEAILNNTSAIDTYLKENSLPSPSFDIDGPVNFGIRSEHVEASRIKVIEASIELADLLHGPMNFLRPLVHPVHSFA